MTTFDSIGNVFAFVFQISKSSCYYIILWFIRRPLFVLGIWLGAREINNAKLVKEFLVP